MNSYSRPVGGVQPLRLANREVPDWNRLAVGGTGFYGAQDTGGHGLLQMRQSIIILPGIPSFCYDGAVPEFFGVMVEGGYFALEVVRKWHAWRGGEHLWADKKGKKGLSLKEMIYQLIKPELIA